MGADYEKANKAPIMGGTQDNQAVNVTRYYLASGMSTNSLNQSNRRGPISVSGVIEHLYVRAEAPPGVGETFTYALMVEGFASALIVQLGGAVDDRGNDLVNQAPIVAGQELSMRVATSAACAVTRHFWGFTVRT